LGEKSSLLKTVTQRTSCRRSLTRNCMDVFHWGLVVLDTTCVLCSWEAMFTSQYESISVLPWGDPFLRLRPSTTTTSKRPTPLCFCILA
ncbi:unnamed protein product, partial [Ixodes pacificus]